MAVVPHAPVPVMAVRSEDDVEKNAEAVFLGVVEAVEERLRRIRDLP